MAWLRIPLKSQWPVLVELPCSHAWAARGASWCLVPPNHRQKHDLLITGDQNKITQRSLTGSTSARCSPLPAVIVY